VFQAKIAIFAASLATLSLIGCKSAGSQPAIGNEPGVAQAKEKTTRPAITTFTHPDIEMRFIWLPSRDILVPREQLMAKLDQLKAAGFNRIGIDVQFRGGVLYPNSESLPQVPEAKGEDLLRVCIDAIHARGMKADAWMEYGMYAHFTPNKDDKSMGAWLDAHPELLSVDKNGVGPIARSFGTFYSLDPAAPASAELLAKLNVEVATRYDVDAISFDRMRYAEFDHLGLASRERFEQETGVKFADATDIKTPAGQKLSEWKREQLLKSVTHIADAVRKAKPGLALTSYVVPPDEMMNKSQSYDLWMKAGLLDGIYVSMYGEDITDAAHKAIDLLGGDKSKLYAAINAEQTTANLTTNIEISRQLGLQGQGVWYAGVVDDADAKALVDGPYAKTAKDELKAHCVARLGQILRLTSG
jgi:uncharacterized lipoprotein YddW (UPF0748 family)